ncbi:MAG: metallophosphoesterase [Chloroflexia bacterium]
MRPPVYVMGDVHGYYERIVDLLREQGLLNPQLKWSGDNSTLVFMGDYTDRGTDGIGVIELIMRLEQEARQAGGEVLGLLGNHEICFLGAHFFGKQYYDLGNWKGDFYSEWIRAGGRVKDLERLTQKHIDWICALPAMLLIDERRFIHADALLYYEYGKTAPEVNKNFRTMMRRRVPSEWDKALEGFSGRDAFADGNPDGRENALQFLIQYGGYQIVHGHTPIPKMTGQRYENVWEALVYAGGVCINVDGGICHGGYGFLYLMPPL